jgi:hypothetical protein
MAEYRYRGEECGPRKQSSAARRKSNHKGATDVACTVTCRCLPDRGLAYLPAQDLAMLGAQWVPAFL